MCCVCKRVRDEDGIFVEREIDIKSVKVSHTYCKHCYEMKCLEIEEIKFE